MQKFECSIYSRVGQVVGYSSNPDDIWDGSFNEEAYPMGNYRYVIKATGTKGQELRYDGVLTLMR